MSGPAHDLERLISRHLDDECTPQERRELNARLGRDPAAAALFEEHRALDHEIRHALRRAVRGSFPHQRPLPLWERATRLLAIAAAACLAATFWLAPPQDAASRQGRAAAQGHSWFASPPTGGDTLIETPRRFIRPQIRVGRPEADWIVIPSERPGEFLVVQVNRVLTKTVHIQQDF